MKEIDTLMSCGFNLYESRILLSLHKFRAATAKEIWKDTNIPKNKIYELLEKLRNDSIIQLLPSKPKKYSIISLKAILNQRIESKQQQLRVVKSNIEELTSLSSKQPYEETFWVMEGASAMVDKIVETLETVQEESIGFIDIWTAKPSNLKAIREAVKRGVKFYFLGTITNETRAIAKQYRKIGVEIRHYAVQGAGYSIFDGNKVQLRITDKKIITLWIESEQFASILRKHFFDLWNKAEEPPL